MVQGMISFDREEAEKCIKDYKDYKEAFDDLFLSGLEGVGDILGIATSRKIADTEDNAQRLVSHLDSMKSHSESLLALPFLGDLANIEAKKMEFFDITTPLQRLQMEVQLQDTCSTLERLLASIPGESGVGEVS